MSKHTAYDLKQMQSLPLEAKIIMTKQRIKAWYESWIRYEIVNKNTGKTRYVTATEEPPLKEGEYINSEMDGAVYVSFSGGKDSTVLKHIVDSMYDDVPALFVNTGLEYPEIQKFAMSQKNVITVRPEMRFDEVIKKYGYPVVSKEVSNTINGAKNSIKKGVYSHRLCKLGVKREEYGGLLDEGKYDYDVNLRKSMYMQSKWRFLLDADFDSSSFCCDVMKKKPSKQYEKESGRRAIIGTLANESQNRKTAWMKHGCNAFESKRPTSQPLSFWTEQDILQYIIQFEVPYCPVYGDIIGKDKRNGMVFSADEIRALYCYNDDAILPHLQIKITGCDRTGCIYCAMGCHLEGAPNRFQRLKETHPRQYEYCIKGGEMVDGKWQPSKEGLGLGKVLDYIGVDYE